MPDPDNSAYTPFIGGQSLGDTLGITVDEIKNIVHSFYKKVQVDNILGPIFAQKISQDWDQHLEKMCNFWTTVMFGKSLYRGNPLEAHRKIADIDRSHFDHWLFLFRETLIEVCPNNDHVEAFYQRASNMARVMIAALSVKKSVSVTPPGGAEPVPVHAIHAERSL